jgi:4-hydroxy-2-oxoheptanedioate aldolase
MGSLLKRDLAASKRFKAKLAARQVATLIRASHPSPSLVEKLGEHGFDAVLIDAEHGSVGREGVEEMSRAAALASTAAIIRPEGSVPHLVTGYLGCGVDGFMLPVIRTPAQAQQLVDTLRFSAPLDHASRVLILMIEHIDAVRNLSALLEIEGVDAYMVAPGDLAISMGEDLSRWPQLSERLQSMIDQTIDTIVKSGKTCGMAVTFTDVVRFLGKGVTLLYNHADHMIERGVGDYLELIKPKINRTA